MPLILGAEQMDRVFELVHAPAHGHIQWQRTRRIVGWHSCIFEGNRLYRMRDSVHAQCAQENQRHAQGNRKHRFISCSSGNKCDFSSKNSAAVACISSYKSSTWQPHNSITRQR